MYNDFECNCGCCGNQSNCGLGDNCQCLNSTNNNNGCNCTAEFTEVNDNLEQIIALDTEIENDTSGIVTLLEDIKECVCADDKPCPCADEFAEVNTNLVNINNSINDCCEDISDKLEDIEELLIECCDKLNPEECALFDNPKVVDNKLVYEWTNYDPNIFKFGQICLTFLKGASNNLQVYVDIEGELTKVVILGDNELISVPPALTGIKLDAIFSAAQIGIFKNQNLNLLTDLLSIL